MVGVAPNRFDPNMILNRETAATGLARTFKKWYYPGWTFPTDANFPLDYGFSIIFGDNALISYWAWDSVQFMAINGVIRGFDDGTFRPRNSTSRQVAEGYANATRQQAIAMALRMVEHW